MSDLHETLQTLLLRGAILVLFGLIAWAGSVVAIGLAVGAARAMVSLPALDWANENAAILALFLTTFGYAMLLVRPVANEH
ncbi:hypothetical protein SAMN02745157_2070 [Kaistia soli DSM 19436]|uniref:Uncharacterized protein n=1 Tax=Kaistia soli DSM 19436 TaxID=1122133 RepID=A0A1M5AAP8_9HYPH|nr:hypothetical protein [Kaistia soli]SHF27349.1 hypothetical protein SAMN02745157_2070 [Kaistia soli DSM 19436]